MPLYKINDKLIYFAHIPKTGGTSVEDALGRVGKVCLNKKPEGIPIPAQHFHAEIFDVLIPSNFYDRGYLICRNPYMRLISEYRHQWVRKRFTKTSFDSWAKKVLRKYKTNPALHHNHIRPQIEFLSKKIEIYKFENGLQQVVNEICDYCGVPDQIDLSWFKCYEKQEIVIHRKTLERVAAFYEKDFDTFGYDMADISFAAANKIILAGY